MAVLFDCCQRRADVTTEIRYPCNGAIFALYTTKRWRANAEIARIGGFKLLMFFQDENPPHVHLKGADFAAKIRISNGEILAGDAPRRALKLARQWIQEHQASLVEQWNEFQR